MDSDHGCPFKSDQSGGFRHCDLQKNQQYWPVRVREEIGWSGDRERERHGLKANELHGMLAWDVLIEFDVKPFKSRDPVRQTQD